MPQEALRYDDQRARYVFIALLACVRGEVGEDIAAFEFFEKQVRPILAARCHKCHGPEKQESDLRLDSAVSARRGGLYGAAVVPGKPRREPDYLGHKLSERGFTNATRRASACGRSRGTTSVGGNGAPWPAEDDTNVAKPFDLSARKAGHWAWQPVRRLPVPVVHAGKWPRNEVDHFVLHRLEERGLKPAVDADRRTLVRRVYFDLVGMPPTPDETEDFLADQSPAAFERVVDHLLSSPEFGERWARHWFDLVRFAETYGHEGDYAIPHAWQYRDYLIRALNADVPYDEFVMEHIAGDLAQSPRRHPAEGYNESIIGTGFWFMYEQTHAPTDVRQHEADRVENQLDVMTKAVFGNYRWLRPLSRSQIRRDFDARLLRIGGFFEELASANCSARSAWRDPVKRGATGLAPCSRYAGSSRTDSTAYACHGARIRRDGCWHRGKLKMANRQTT